MDLRGSRILLRVCSRIMSQHASTSRKAAADKVYIPETPCPSRIDQSLVEEPPYFDEKLINHLERLSLVRFSNEQAVAHLRKAVRYANQLMQVNTEGVEPLETVLEDMDCPLRDDVADEAISKGDVLMNAQELVEDYFVTPPGNIPLQEVSKLDLKKAHEWDWVAMDEKKDKK